MTSQKYIILTLLIGIVISFGFLAAILLDNLRSPIDTTVATLQTNETSMENSLTTTETTFNKLKIAAGSFDSSLKQTLAADAKVAEQLANLTSKTAANKNLSAQAYEKMIVNRLGNAIYTANGSNSSIMIFKLQKEDFRGYMAKIKMKTSNSLRITVSPNSSPKGETTSQSAKRNGAIFAVNGGGFATATANGVSQTVPIGNTMIKGKLVNKFMPTNKDLAFVGFTYDNKLVGGKYQTKAELKKSGAWQGVTFVPSLIKDWEPLTIPSKWATTRQPRTVLGQYPNGDIFFIVVDGRQSNWSNGITLEEMQVLLLRLGVMEAYNLDGGGSSAMYYNGSILNKPSDGAQRKMATNIVVFK